MSKNGSGEQREWLRELASRTLEAYRRLNAVAANAAYAKDGKPDTSGLSQAGELLEEVIAELRGTVKSAAG